MKRWTHGTMRQKLLDIPQGEAVVVIQSTIKHRGPIGPTFWVMSVPQRVVYQVSESAYGRNLGQLVSLGKEVELSKQDDCEHRAKGILATNGSAYLPENRKRMTYLDTPSKHIPKGFRYVDTSAS